MVLTLNDSQSFDYSLLGDNTQYYTPTKLTLVEQTKSIYSDITESRTSDK